MAPNQNYDERSYAAPYRGFNNMAENILIPPSDSPFLKNVIFRNQAVGTRPVVKPLMPAPQNDSEIRALTSFVDSNNASHTCAITSTRLYQLSAAWRDSLNSGDLASIWPIVGSPWTSAPSSAPIQTLLTINQLYWTTGTPGVFYWDGISNNISIATATFGGYFLGELAFHIILCNTIEDVAGVATNYPQRVRWAASGQPTQWNPATNINAGFNDMLDVPDAITGFLTIGRNGFVFRTNGITEMVPTGVGTAPFSFNHMWASDKGIGNVQPQTIASYGPTGIFISSEEIYQIAPSSFETIGMGARDEIFSDLSRATSNILGTIVPLYAKKYIYPTYILTIPISDSDCIWWVYSIIDKNWTRWEFSKGFPTARIRFVPTR